MEAKDKFLLKQLGLTFGLLITAAALLKPTVFWGYQLFLLIGSLSGFAFGWYNRTRIFEGFKYISDGAILIALAWVAWRISESSFLYKEVIAVLIQGVIILEIIFSFDFNAPGKLAYIRLLSLLIFMACPIFPWAYSIFLALAYLLIWLAVLRFQFEGFAQPVREKGARRYYSLMAALVCFLLAVIFAWLIASHVYLGRIKQKGIFWDSELQDTGSGGGNESEQADKFFSLQDDFQNKLSELAFKLETYEDKRKLIFRLSELVKEITNPAETAKAEDGLIDILRRQGPGIEGIEEAVKLTKKYLDQKISGALQEIKDQIMDTAKDSSAGMMAKIKVISTANRLQQADTYQQLQSGSKALQKAIQNVPGQGLQEKLSTKAGKLTDLKTLELYRKKMHKQADGAAKSSAGNKDLQGMSDAQEALLMKADLFFPGGSKGETKGEDNRAEPQSDGLSKEEEGQSERQGQEQAPREDLSSTDDSLFRDKQLKGIKITPKQLEISLGEKGGFSAEGIYDDGSLRDLTIAGDWGTLDKAVAVVSAGRVTCISAGQTDVYVEFDGIRSEYVRIAVKAAKLVSLSLAPESLNLEMGGKGSLKVQGNYYDRSARDLTDQAGWKFEGAQIVKIKNGVLSPSRFGRTKIYAEYSGLRSNHADVGVVLTLGWCLKLLVKIAMILLALISGLLFILYLCVENKRMQLESLRDKPSEFILKLYENACALTAIFGQRYEAHIPPLKYAQLVEGKFSSQSHDFMGLSIKFEEAKYSRHLLDKNHSRLAADNYNRFFKQLLNDRNKFRLLWRYFLSLCHCRPVFVRCP